MTFHEWWQGLGRSHDPETIWKAAQRAALAKEREACHVESRPDGYWLVLKNKSGGAAINLDGPSHGPIVRTVLMVAALDAAGKEAGG